ncbi:phosphoesterase RecJ domain-containing protein [Saccharopolyspora antimicrobica]|uniref:Phosphoesterase RecJ domain-containing protein n=1 Tax=Saccharopolyspora antimicrobica TaxID=455193 RepID=A0A1I4STW5_9PSEU|nr:phosphoesterase RecJ-like protein [Saccharopolyspora antimicrobica]SFM67988.1 phosphoesterase RecJ domain-containing protein [Saccharopolyspora antimicrobica]
MRGQPEADDRSGVAADPVAPAVVAAARKLADATDVTLFGHVNPDADALGSALALGRALRRRGCTVRVSFGTPDLPPASLRDLDGDGLVVPVDEVPAAPPTLVVCDTGSLQRLGRLADRVAGTIEAGGDVIVIDHHVSNTRYGTLHVVDEYAEATVMIVLRLLDELGAELDLPIARCLYAGLVTDTRSFRHASARTHEVAARLLRAGVDPEATTRPLLDTHPFGWMGMLAGVLGAAELEPSAARGLGFVHATVRLADSDGLRSEELDSVIDVLRTTSEAEVTAVLKEMAPQNWSVSLRADSRLDVGHAAAACGGGGHRLASGFTAQGKPEDIIESIRKALDEAPFLD